MGLANLAVTARDGPLSRVAGAVAPMCDPNNRRALSCAGRLNWSGFIPRGVG